ncbi:hypothetical protein MKX03_026652 [Papaver bracteatum]|nr:hypothetical protein MKX03_026652 [Papaver bracteatum]
MNTKGRKRFKLLYTKRNSIQRLTTYHESQFSILPDTNTSTWKLANTTIFRNIEQYPGASKGAF